MKLFELADNYRELEMLVESGEVTEAEIEDTLLAIKDGIEVKVDSIGWLISEAQAKADAYKAQVDRFKEKQESSKRKVESLKNLLNAFLTATNTEKLETPNYKVSYRKSVKTKVLDLDKVPDEFITEKIERKPRLKDIKEYIEVFGDVEWATLEENKNLQIK